MTLLWTTPREWTTKDAITKERLNAISDDLNYLINPSRATATVRGTGANTTVALTTFTNLDVSNYGLSVELTGVRDVRVKLQGKVSNATLAAITFFDVYIDNSIYLSSLSGTALTQGVWAATQYVAANLIPVVFDVSIPAGVLAAGVHTFQLRWRVSAGTSTFYDNANNFAQFSVGE